MSIEIGVIGRSEGTVTDENTAIAAGSGTLPVFGTPFLCALMENAAIHALSPHLGEGESSVGTRLDVSHDAATPVGMAVWAEAEVTAVDRRKITFLVRAFDSVGQIGGGTHERFIIDTEKFMAKAAGRAG